MVITPSGLRNTFIPSDEVIDIRHVSQHIMADHKSAFPITTN